MDQTFDLPEASLLEFERTILRAIERRSVDQLHVLGFGEVGVAVAWPHEQPRLVVKRLLSFADPADAASALERVRTYASRIAPHVQVAPTELRTIVNDEGRTVSYLIQNLYPAEQLMDTVLAAETPTRDHPAVVAVRDAAVSASGDGRQAIDSQFSNFAWDGSTLTTFDIGTPFLFREDGTPEGDHGAMVQVLPAALRPIAMRQVNRITAELGGRRGNLEHAAMSLVRMGHEQWLDPAIHTFNQVLDDPLRADSVRTRATTLHGRMRLLKQMMRLQRAWATKVRRTPYDFFITDSYTGEIR